MKILAFGPHPDDVEFGCAPILMQEADRGHQVRIVVATRGESASSGTPEQREGEARAAAKLIGASIEFLDVSDDSFSDLGSDCRIQYSPASSILIARQIRMFQPHIVLAPTLDENQHPDHAALARTVRDAARLARYAGLDGLKDLPAHAVAHLFFYSITQLFTDPPDIVMNVSAVYDRWVQAMECHRSQMATRNYVDLVTARARATGAAIGTSYAVGLWTNDPLRVASLADLPLSARYF
jgi:LmbE family N-acetylglucosaminyl deacetylase